MASNSFNHGGAATTINDVHPNIIETHILTKFDGQSLASSASTSQLLHTLCKNENLWKNICNSTWKSVKHPLVRQTISAFPGGYRSFYSDSFPLLRPNPGPGSCVGQVQTSELISAVDIHYGNNPVNSKVIVTNVDNNSFLQSSFCIDLLDCKETAKIPLQYEGYENKCMLELEENLTLSWILINPTLKRAANVSSLRPVSVQPYWNGSAIKMIYATILYAGMDTSEFVECRIVAIFECEDGKFVELRELSLCVVDMDRARLNGEMSLRILEEAMVSGKTKKENGGEGKGMYLKYLDLKRKRRDGQKRLNKEYRVLWVTHFMIWVLFVVSVITSLCFSW